MYQRKSASICAVFIQSKDIVLWFRIQFMGYMGLYGDCTGRCSHTGRNLGRVMFRTPGVPVDFHDPYPTG